MAGPTGLVAPLSAGSTMVVDISPLIWLNGCLSGYQSGLETVDLNSYDLYQNRVGSYGFTYGVHTYVGS
jgi:hypothetical protein